MALARINKCCRSLLREPSKGVFCGVIQPGWIEGCIGAKRHLLSEDVIKLQDFQQRKLAVAHLLHGVQGNYIEQFSQKLQRNELIKRDELKLLLHLCQSADDIMIARNAIYRYHAENKNKNLMTGQYKFGPLFMRLCYEHELEDLAAATLTDQCMKGFFTDITSFNIAIDMLFTKGYYESALEVLRTMRDRGLLFNQGTYTLVSGVCYKLNTAESFKTCNTLIEEGQIKGDFIPRHAYCFAVALAVRQNDIKKAQSLFSQIMRNNNILAQNLKVLTLVMSGALNDALSILSVAVLQMSIFVRKPEFSQEVVDLLRMRCEGGPYMVRMEQVVSQLEEANQVTQQTLDDMLCRTPTTKRQQSSIMDMRRTSQRPTKPFWTSLLLE